MRYRLFVPLALLAVGFVFLVQPANAQNYGNVRIVRLSFLEGTVQYQRPGQEWEGARLNQPIKGGFALRTADGYAEVEFEDSLVMRVGTNSTVAFTDLALTNAGRATQLTISEGTAIIDTKLGRTDSLSVAVPNLSVKVPRGARFRVDVTPAETWVTVFRGQVEVNSGSQAATILANGHTLHENANGSGSPEIAGIQPRDAFDKWVSDREDDMREARRETATLLGSKGYSEGFADLYNYGLWSDALPGIGLAWRPYGMDPSWIPFVNGEWLFTQDMGGWNWVSSEPWGWVPYHFGSWVNVPGTGWAWLPVGPNSWMPATASWVDVHGQLGWIPTGVPPVSKPTKAQRANTPATVILATQNSGSAIRAGSQIDLKRPEIGTQAVATAPPAFVAPTSRPSPSQATQVAVRPVGSTMASKAVQSAPAPRPGGASAPAALRAPSDTVARSGFAPPAIRAPHASPLPNIPASARGGMVAGATIYQGGSVGGPHAGGGATVGRMGTHTGGGSQASTRGGTAGSASQSGAALSRPGPSSGGSAAGHR